MDTKEVKAKSVSRTFRIPEKVDKEIIQEAAERNTTVSEVAIGRLQHSKKGLTPEMMVKVQDIVNVAVELCGNNEKLRNEITGKAEELWKILK